MSFRKLKIFYETAKCLNMSQVAKELYISQPSISQTIGELELDLGVKLFDRIGKRLFLTHEGEIFYNYSRRILNLYDEGINKVKESKEMKGGKIVVGASTTIGIYILPSIIRKFLELNPNIEISLIIENTANIEKMILENKVDFAFVEGNVYSEEIKVEKFMEDELVFICGKMHPLKSKGEINIQEIKNEKLILREIGSGTRERVENFLKDNEINYNVFMELGNTEAIKKMVDANLGIGCVAKSTISDELNRGDIYILEYNNKKISRDLFIITNKDKFISNNMVKFMEYIKNLDR